MPSYTHQQDTKLASWLDELATDFIKKAAPGDASPESASEAPSAPPVQPPQEAAPTEGIQPTPQEPPPAPDGQPQEPTAAPQGAPEQPPPASDGTNQPVGGSPDEAASETPSEGSADVPPPAADAQFAPPPSGGEMSAAPSEEPAPATEGNEPPKTEKTDEEKTTDVADALDKLQKNLDKLNEQMQGDVQKGITDTAEKFNEQINNVTKEIGDLKTNVDGLSKEKSIEEQMKSLKQRMDNLAIPETVDMNSSIYQSASIKIGAIKRHARRISSLIALASVQELEMQKHWYDSTRKMFSFELSEVDSKLKINLACKYGVKLTNPRTQNSILFKFVKMDTDGEETYGWRFVPDGQSFGVKGLLIIND